MGRLKTLKGGLQTIAPTLARLGSFAIERKRGGAGVRDRNKIRERDCGLCQECKRNGFARTGAQVDHITPLWKGGSDESGNKELLCCDCHDAKTKRETAERAGGG